MKTFKILSILVVLLLTSNLLSAIFVANDHEQIFPEPNSSVIGNLVVGGASDFLSSYSDALQVLSEYELAVKEKLNFETASSKASSALAKLEGSRKKYGEALGIAKNTFYLKEYQNKLSAHNYSLEIEGKRFNKIIADEAISYLKEGDVIGFYQKNLDNIDEILLILRSIVENQKLGQKIDNSVFWNLLQRYSEASLFANYSTVLANSAFNQ